MAWDLHKLFLRHANGITRSLRRRGLSEETAADITQDTFLRVLIAPPAENITNSNPAAYLYQVSRNLGINHQRRERLFDKIDSFDEAVANVADPFPLPDAVVYDRQRLRLTEAALAELPDRSRRAFELHRLGELTMSQVGQEIGLSTSRTWALIRDAYRHIVMRTSGL
ncbi:sigma-70 family RNA polymerase sigma factor [Rhizobiaceae bacterium CRRU44]|uniref:Sigma-70 family RNA polymerase sigma factor n=1 Tax=Ferranicluibacter rubi TaxID=2715133 RepID=A0AA43ZF16_9HYPH|nr:sigma-70 family RNA polymerase sigma factor [Ferranicluibacter rubi]